MGLAIKYKLSIKIYANFDVGVGDMNGVFLRKIKSILYLDEKKVAKVMLYVIIITKIATLHFNN